MEEKDKFWKKHLHNLCLLPQVCSPENVPLMRVESVDDGSKGCMIYDFTAYLPVSLFLEKKNSKHGSKNNGDDEDDARDLTLMILC